MQSTKPSVPLSSAMEDYLEAIYHLEQERRIARVRDIANRLKVKMSSVSSALKILGSRGLISYDPHQFITLTDRGMIMAKEIVRKHEVLKRFLSRILILDDATAEDNACRIEHHLDPEVIERLTRFVEFMEMCPVDQRRWHESFAQSCTDCESCLNEARLRTASRARAQREALEEGLTLVEAEQGAQVMVDRISGPAELVRRLAGEGVSGGAILEIESRDESSGDLQLNVKGYHVRIPSGDAANILVKPI